MHRLQMVLKIILLQLLWSLAGSASPDYTEKHFDQTLDHFNSVSYGDKTFKQRYLIQDKWWSNEKGPIFFYTGNEGPITQFWDATGFVFDIAPQFGALVVFAEHILKKTTAFQISVSVLASDCFVLLWAVPNDAWLSRCVFVQQKTGMAFDGIFGQGKMVQACCDELNCQQESGVGTVKPDNSDTELSISNEVSPEDGTELSKSNGSVDGKTGKRTPWSEDEKKVVETVLEKFFALKKLPGKHHCE